MNQDALEGLLHDFVSICLDLFGAKYIEAIIQHGSSVKGGAIPGYSDLDLQVYLAPTCFDEHVELPDATAFAFQERFAMLPWQESGFGYAQVYFHDWRRPPSDWTGPPPGTYRELFGKLPPAIVPSADQMRDVSRRLLRDSLPARIRWSVRGFVDSGPEAVRRRIRLLGTDVSPAILSLAAHDAEDPLSVWALSKFDALEIIEQRYPGEGGPPKARRFYDGVRRLYGGVWEDALARETFRAGIEFLRWVEGLALGTTPVEPDGQRR